MKSSLSKFSVVIPTVVILYAITLSLYAYMLIDFVLLGFAEDPSPIFLAVYYTFIGLSILATIWLLILIIKKFTNKHKR